MDLKDKKRCVLHGKKCKHKNKKSCEWKGVLIHLCAYYEPKN
ncbi:MAG: hypothetical protein ACTSQJ_00520 [Promethearchaeota archaeon]